MHFSLITSEYVIKIFFNPIDVVIPPKANAILAKLMVIIVKNKVLKDFIYFIISKRIARLINVIHDNRIVTFVINTILEIKMINNDKKIKIGKIG